MSQLAFEERFGMLAINERGAKPNTTPEMFAFSPRAGSGLFSPVTR
jgi:hypothetical protein